MPSDGKVGTLLQDRYRLDSVLQEGGMSTVYSAFDTVLNARVAIKELKEEGVDPQLLPAMVNQFRQEAQLVASLDHRGLPKVSNFFEASGACYLVMEYIDGETLQHKAQRQGGALPERLVLTWGYEIVQVLDHLHRHNPQIVFRDLKPTNVMVCRDGHVKLIDFGISKWGEHGAGTDQLLRGSGTMGYAPPEQCSSTHAYTDARSDIYALGATLYTVLAYRIPVGSMERALGTAEHIPLAELDPTMSKRVARAVDKMMQLRPEDRYQSAREVRYELARLLGGAPTVDELQLPPELESPVMAAPVPEPPRPKTLPNSKPQAPARTRPLSKGLWLLLAVVLLVGGVFWVKVVNAPIVSVGGADELDNAAQDVEVAADTLPPNLPGDEGHAVSEAQRELRLAVAELTAASKAWSAQTPFDTIPSPPALTAAAPATPLYHIKLQRANLATLRGSSHHHLTAAISHIDASMKLLEPIRQLHTRPAASPPS